MHILYAVRAERGEGEEGRGERKNSEPTAKGEGDTVGRKKEEKRREIGKPRFWKYA